MSRNVRYIFFFKAGNRHQFSRECLAAVTLLTFASVSFFPLNFNLRGEEKGRERERERERNMVTDERLFPASERKAASRSINQALFLTSQTYVPRQNRHNNTDRPPSS